jgi:hypothetical protein
MNSSTLVQNSIVGIAIVLLTLTLWWGVMSGKARAQSRVIVANAASLVDAFEFFRSDYDRYPTNLEFSQTTALGTYLSGYPIEKLVSKKCSENYFYDAVSFDTYRFAFCAPQGYSGFAKGWNTIR